MTNQTPPRSVLGLFVLPTMMLASCAVTSITTNAPAALAEGDESHFAAQLVYTETDLDEVTVEEAFINDDDEFETGDFEIDLGMNRERLEARFGFGGERVRGGFMIFTEQMAFEFNDVESEETDLYGIGGGMIGAPRIGEVDDDPATLTMVVPYDWDLAIAYGDDLIELAYAELAASVGFGVEWMGLQPSVGVTGSGLYGLIEDGEGDLGATIDGFNFGFYGQVRYAPPGIPLLIHARGTGGDIEAFEIGAGVQI